MEPIIPQISEDVCYSIEKQMESGEFLTGMAKHIREHNPVVGGFLHSFMGRHVVAERQCLQLS